MTLQIIITYAFWVVALGVLAYGVVDLVRNRKGALKNGSVIKRASAVALLATLLVPIPVVYQTKTYSPEGLFVSANFEVLLPPPLSEYSLRAPQSGP